MANAVRFRRTRSAAAALGRAAPGILHLLVIAAAIACTAYGMWQLSPVAGWVSLGLQLLWVATRRAEREKGN